VVESLKTKTKNIVVGEDPEKKDFVPVRGRNDCSDLNRRAQPEKLFQLTARKKTAKILAEILPINIDLTKIEFAEDKRP